MPLPVMDLFRLERLMQPPGSPPPLFAPPSSRLFGRRLSVLVIGTSETNRHRIGSLGTAQNAAWSNEVRGRYQVMGFWPAFLMHDLDAIRLEYPPLSLEALHDFARKQYLYERGRIYRWRSADLWNIATPGGNSRHILHMLRLQRPNLAAFPADLVVICPGMGDRSGTVARGNGMDLLEPGFLDGIPLEERYEFPPAEDADEFRDTLSHIDATLEGLYPGVLRVYLGVFRLLSQSRRTAELTRGIELAIQEQATSSGQAFVGFDFMGDTPELLQHWLLPDHHPTDEANRRVARNILDVSLARLHATAAEAA